ncbi:unnamed protein product [Linum trigynum]|uniref:Protein LURP-one-related 11 n=1 Tax=Linum trigynum TaxID=586398 RepID=A0AAV2FRU6_9ROSI
MGKIHPIFSTSSAAAATATASPSRDVTSTTETFTMWMKSLVMNGNGCTIYDQNGAVVYRVDNYQKKGCREVCLMDLKGNIVFTILRTAPLLLCPFLSRMWKGYRCDEETASFCVARRTKRLFATGLCCEVVGCDGRYKMEASSGGKLTAFKITDVVSGGVVAEAKRKHSTSTAGTGVLLGNDVLTLVVGAGVDRSFVMALATVYGLMSSRL